jgi:hypothetical protein
MIIKNTNPTDFGGLLGTTVSIRKVASKTIITHRPNNRKVGEPSAKQAAVMERFLEASQYANHQMTLPDIKALYATGITGKGRSAYLVAMTDYLIPPTAIVEKSSQYDGTVGSLIVVKAVDDFMVTRVKVIITSAAGVLIEQGEAVQDPVLNHNWQYTATVANPSLPGTVIKAIAYDRPGNAGMASVVM